MAFNLKLGLWVYLFSYVMAIIGNNDNGKILEFKNVRPWIQKEILEDSHIWKKSFPGYIMIILKITLQILVARMTLCQKMQTEECLSVLSFDFRIYFGIYYIYRVSCRAICLCVTFWDFPEMHGSTETVSQLKPIATIRNHSTNPSHICFRWKWPFLAKKRKTCKVEKDSPLGQNDVLIKTIFIKLMIYYTTGVFAGIDTFLKENITQHSRYGCKWHFLAKKHAI